MPRLPRKLPSSTPYASEWNKMIDSVASLRPVPSAGVLTDHGVHGVSRRAIMQPRGSGGGGITLQWLRVNAVRANYYVCHSWDGSTEGSDPIYVARPFNHRNSIASETIDGVAISYSYTSTTGRIASFTIDSVGYTETQIMVPWFISTTTTIAATTLATGIVTASPDTTDIPISLIDLNIDGRAWAAVFGSDLTISEQDGAPAIPAVRVIRVTNGSLTDEGDGIVSLENV